MKAANKEPKPIKRQTASGEKHVERVRRLCLALPETWEKLSHGEPTFFVKKRGNSDDEMWWGSDRQTFFYCLVDF